LLNIFELVVSSVDEKEIIITNDLVVEKAQQNIVRYDKNGEQHYDIISAFIKSIRGSDPNAAVYWLARMIEGGEDVKFIARRLLILASEDIGNANPTALVIANNCFQAINVIGYPEAKITLSQTVIYLACSEKSNSSYKAINEAMEEVEQSGNLSVPLHLRNAPTKLLKELGYGKDYINSHIDTKIIHDFLPEEISSKIFYQPSNNFRENKNKDYLQKKWKGKYNY
ncbi:MAG: replication-associated recombination protein A, partial [Flavobacteriales bacterium]|nr:replication-associated recombination protein A [Flavobacteriales bacterium]